MTHSSTLRALGASATEVNTLVRVVADVAARELATYAIPDAASRGGWIAQACYAPLAQAVLNVKEQGMAAGREEAREVLDAVAARIGEAITLLGAAKPDLEAARDALRRAAMALAPTPTETPR